MLRVKRRFFAVAALGANRCYWVVWPSLEELQASEEPLLHIDEGCEKTKAEAVDRALQEEPVFFDRPRHDRARRFGGQLAQCLKMLNLSWPCTVADVKQAYRRLVKRAHPDGGGSHDQFLALQEAYEQALRMCR
jgi:hypothetical protein